MSRENEMEKVQDLEEYITFTITAKDGSQVEMAVVDQFEFEKKNYVVAARIVGDEIDGEGSYIYRCRMTEDGFKTEKITNAIDYEKVVQAYMEMEE